MQKLVADIDPAVEFVETKLPELESTHLQTMTPFLQDDKDNDNEGHYKESKFRKLDFLMRTWSVKVARCHDSNTE